MLNVVKIKEIPKLAKNLFWQMTKDWNLNIKSSKTLENQGHLDRNIAKKQIDIL